MIRDWMDGMIGVGGLICKDSIFIPNKFLQCYALTGRSVGTPEDSKNSKN
jgi:hypothetical protein